MRLVALALAATRHATVGVAPAGLRHQYTPLELPHRAAEPSDDWLLGSPPSNTTARLVQLDPRTLALSNNLVARVFTLTPEWSTWDIVSAGQGSALRAPAPEAMLTIDEVQYAVGGLTLDLNASAFAKCSQTSKDPWYPSGQQAEACPTGWWNRSLPLLPDPAAFRYSGHAVSAPVAPFPWKPARHAPDAAWPPKGVHLAVNFTAPPSAPQQPRHTVITIHYQLLNGAPIMSKWVTVALRPPRLTIAVPSAEGLLTGALSIQPCDTNPAVAPAEWGFVWKLPQPGAADATIQLGGKSSGRDVCMSVITAPAFFTNADVGLRPCNASDPMQRCVPRLLAYAIIDYQSIIDCCGPGGRGATPLGRCGHSPQPLSSKQPTSEAVCRVQRAASTSTIMPIQADWQCRWTAVKEHGAGVHSLLCRHRSVRF